jgi:hypothetical protein
VPNGWYPLGLTVAELKTSVQTETTLQPISRKRYCAYLKRVSVTVSYGDFIVYIDRKYIRGSCEYRAIRDHEDTHVAIFRDKLNERALWLRQNITRAAARLGSVVVSSRNLGADRIQAMLMRKITPLLETVQRASERENREIDTVSSYRMIQARCSNW